MRKKWEIEEEYRNFCRNNKELALQTLRELTLTPTETGKEDQRIAYCMEWMKQQGIHLGVATASYRTLSLIHISEPTRRS